jgi:hypothetical protein
MIAVFPRWSCDEALEIETFDLNLPNAKRNNEGMRAGENAVQRSKIPHSVGLKMKQRQKGYASERKVTEESELPRTSVMEPVPRLDALQTEIPRYPAHSCAIDQPVQVAPRARATS